MPKSKSKPDVPSTIAKSDKHAQAIWKKTHDSAVKTYGEGERAHRTAFASLKHQYKKEGDRWVKKGWKGPSDPQAAQGAKDKPKQTAGGKIARTEKEAASKAKEARREYQQHRRATRKKAASKTTARRTAPRKSTAKTGHRKATRAR